MKTGQLTGEGGPRVIIIGAGMSGVVMAIKLRKSGFNNIQLYEKGTGVGGTWRENDYPGLHCDVASHHYVYSFAPNPEWTRDFSPGPEIRAYFEDIAERAGVISLTRFNTKVEDAKWDGARWHVGLDGGEVDVADVLISATGFLHVAAYPTIEGLDSFEGSIFHTTRWDHGISLNDKRIGLIGTGSTAVQIVCALSGKVRRLTLFQRTPQWVLRIENGIVPERMKKRLRRFPFLMKILYKYNQFRLAKFAAGVMGEDNPKVRKFVVEQCEANLATVRNPELRGKLTPNYKPGCKRLVMSPDFYEKVQDPSVDLVAEGITRIEANGIRTADGKLHELDVLVLATGFDMKAFMRPMTVTGERGLTLEDAWSNGPQAYQSIMIPGFPNFFMFTGPYSPAGNLSNTLMSECIADYVLRFVKIIARRGLAIAPDEGATVRQMKQYKIDATKTIWGSGGCKSYYLDKDGVPMMYPYGPDRFIREMNRKVDMSNFVVKPLVTNRALETPLERV